MDIAILIILILIVALFVRASLKYMNKKVSNYKGIDPSHEVDNLSEEDK